MNRPSTALALALVAVTMHASSADEGSAPGADPNAVSAFGHPEPGADFETLSDIRLGTAVFRQVWTPAGEGSPSFDGLGPLFNAASCESCHVRDGRGRAASPDPEDVPSVLLMLGRPAGPVGAGAAPDPSYGHQINDRAIPGHRAEARVEVRHETSTFTYPDGTSVELRRPVFALSERAYGPLSGQTAVSARLPQQMIGLGLLERIPEDDILAAADPNDADGDGTSGRVNRTYSRVREAAAIGRFGWKAGQATVADQISVAFNRDMGIATPFDTSATGDCTPVQTACLGAADGRTEDLENLEAHSAVMHWITAYSSNLAVPPPRPLDTETARLGGGLFETVGCAACHRPEFTTGDDPDQPHLSNRRISPYTDLLLHDMGPDLADGLPEAAASGSEWRTAPLWGIGLTGSVNGNTFYLHDGRARSLEEAILWHGGEALDARNGFAKLAAEERQALLDFVAAL